MNEKELSREGGVLKKKILCCDGGTKRNMNEQNYEQGEGRSQMRLEA